MTEKDTARLIVESYVMGESGTAKPLPDGTGWAALRQTVARNVYETVAEILAADYSRRAAFTHAADEAQWLFLMSTHKEHT